MSTIADVTTTDRRARGKGPLAAIWNGLLAIRLADHRYHGLTRLSRQSDDARAAKFSEFMNTFADFRAIARRVLGPATRQMSEAQLEAYYQAFERYAVAVYQDQLDQFRGEEIRVVGSRDLSDRNSHVTSMIKSSDTGKDVEVIWDVLESRDGDKYLVRDVALNIGGNNQFWLAVDQNQDFQAFLKRNNNDIDKLIENINQMTASMNARG